MKGGFRSRSDLKNVREEKQKDEQTLKMIRNVCTALIVMCVLTLLMFCMSGCRTKHVVEYRDSVIVDTKDVVIKDTVKIEIPAEVKERETRDSTSFLETGLAKSLAKLTWKDGEPWLFHLLENKPQTIEKEVEVKEKTKTIYRTRYVTRIEYVEKKLSWWQTTFIWMGGALFLLIVGVIGWFVVKKFVLK